MKPSTFERLYDDLHKLKKERDFYKNLLSNIYKAADYLGEKADSRARDLSRDETYRAVDRGLADAYFNIRLMIINWDSLGKADYYAANKVVKDLPSILK